MGPRLAPRSGAAARHGQDVKIKKGLIKITKMLLSQNASAMRPLNLYLMVYISLVFGVLQALPDFSEDSCIFKVTLRNFRVILSWELKNHSIVPTHYTLWHTLTSKPEDRKAVKDCTNITGSFCDLTDVWENLSKLHLPRLVGSRGNTTLVDCVGRIFLPLNLSLEPPNFEIVGFTDHIEVRVKFPPVIPKILRREGLYVYLPLVIKEESGGIVKQHKPEINAKTVTENFTYVIDNLIPNTSYCVSVYFQPDNLGKTIESPTKCILLPPGEESESSDSAKIVGLVTTFFIVAVFVSTVVLLQQIGYICLRNKLPKVLNFYNFSAWVFPELLPLEAAAALEVIHVNRKKKVWDYNYDDESDSDSEAALQTSAGGYTMHGLTGRPLCPASASSATLEDCGNPDAEETDLPEPEAESESLMAPGPGPWQPECTSEAYQGRWTPLEDPLSEEDSSSMEGSGDRIIFNVDLNSVFVRVLDDNIEAPPVLTLPDDTTELEEPNEMEINLLVASGGGTQPAFPSPSVECLWPENSLSEKSDTSESDVDTGDGYIMRRIP